MKDKEEIKHILDANVDILTYKADKDFRCLTSTEKALLENNEKIKEYIEHLESREQKLIEKLEKDIVNITKTMQDGKHCDDYSRCRLKAYRTKTKEILEILK